MSLVELSSAKADEVARIMVICNACRYCEGLCAVFPAMEKRRTFALGDVDYLANLCHGCGACYHDCQYAPPHEFAVNAPAALAELREETYSRYAWPGFLAPVFANNGLWIALSAGLGVAAFILGFVALQDPSVLFGASTGEGSFYRLMPHGAMVALFGGVFLYAMLALAFSVRRFWVETGAAGSLDGMSLWQAMKDAAGLRYLDGGGVGCMNEDEKPDDNRRLYHHLTFYGFMLCFAATVTGTVFHYGFGWEAPYPWYSPVKIFGVLGGIGLLIGPWGLAVAKARQHKAVKSASRSGMDAAFLLMLFTTSLTGMALYLFRETPAMGLLLATHLGIVFALFLTFPYGKFVHGLYRFAALIRHAAEERKSRSGS